MEKKYVIQFNYDGKVCSYTITSTNDFSVESYADEELLRDTINVLIRLDGLYKKGMTVSGAVLFNGKGEIKSQTSNFVATL